MKKRQESVAQKHVSEIILNEAVERTITECIKLFLI